MRDFEERRAEIFRRSAKRMAVRRRRQVLLAVIPTAVCLVLAVGAQLRAGVRRPITNDGDGIPDTVVTDGVPIDSASPVDPGDGEPSGGNIGVPGTAPVGDALPSAVTIRFPADTGEQRFHDPKTVEEICRAVQQAAQLSHDGVKGDADKDTAYTIIFTHDGGLQTVYLLDGCVLYPPDGLSPVQLSEEQTAALRSALRLPTEKTE